MARRRGQRKGWLRAEGGSWLLTYRIYPMKGKPERETVTIGPASGPGKLSEKQAERFAWDHYLSKVDEVSRRPKSMMTVGDFWDESYQRHCQLKLKKTTREQYFSLYTCWIQPILQNKPIGTLSVEMVESCAAKAIEAGKSTATARHIRKVISAIFTRAKKLQVVTGDNPAALADLPELVAVRPKLALSAEQCRSVLAALPPAIRAMALTATITSMNVAEMCGLQWKHCNLTANWITFDGEGIPPFTVAVRRHFSRGEFGTLKTGNRKRNVPMPEMLVTTLLDLRRRPKFIGSEDVVFASDEGTPINQNNERKRRLEPLGKRLGLSRLSWHVFRHSHATLTDLVGMNARDRMALMGHSSIDQTNEYTAADYERMRTGLDGIAKLLVEGPEKEKVN